MKWKLNFPKPEILTYYYAKFLGLAPFKFINNEFHPPSNMDKFYLIAVTVIELIFPVTHILKMLATAETEITTSMRVRMLIISLHGISTMFTHITFLLMHKKIIHLMNELCALRKELKNLGIEDGNERVARDIFITTITVNIINFIIVIFLCLVIRRSSAFDLIYTIVRNLVNMNAILILAHILFYIGRRFTLLNKKLNDIFTPDIQDGSAISEAISMVSRELCGENVGNSNSLSDLQCVWRIEILHWKLSNLLDSTIHVYAVPIIINSGRILWELVILFYKVYGTSENRMAPVSNYILLSLSSTFELLLMTYASEKSRQQGNATKNVLFRIRSKLGSPGLNSELVMFSLQLLIFPETNSTFGFFTVGYSLIYKVVCTMFAYLVVMIQFDTSQANQGN